MHNINLHNRPLETLTNYYRSYTPLLTSSTNKSPSITTD